MRPYRLCDEMSFGCCFLEPSDALKSILIAIIQKMLYIIFPIGINFILFSEVPIPIRSCVLGYVGMYIIANCDVMFSMC